MSDVKEVLGNYSSDIIKSIEDDLSVITPNNLQEASIYLPKAGGKMLRPALCLITAEAVGGKKEDALKAGSAIELIHTFSLIHDDIMDEAPLRRGLETVYHKWNSNIALLSGDTMLIKAFQYALSTNKLYSQKILAELCNVALEVCEGQQYDLNFETRDDVTLDEYIEMIRLKTAVLLGSVLKIGAIVAGASEDNMKKVYDFGIDLGIAFQLQDDLFDCYGDVKVFGKMPGGDIADNKKTYLYLKALELASAEDKKLLEGYFSMPKGRDEKKQQAVLDIFEKYNVRVIVNGVMTGYYNNSLQHLEKITVSEEQKSVLRNYADYLYNRIK